MPQLFETPLFPLPTSLQSHSAVTCSSCFLRPFEKHVGRTACNAIPHKHAQAFCVWGALLSSRHHLAYRPELLIRLQRKQQRILHEPSRFCGCMMVYKGQDQSKLDYKSLPLKDSLAWNQTVWAGNSFSFNSTLALS